MFVEQASSLAAEAAALEPWMLTDTELREAALAVHRTRAPLDAVAVRLAGAVDDRGLAIDDGATSTTAWLANQTGIVKAEAGKLVALSRIVGEETAATAAAWAAGDLTTDQASVIMKAIDALPYWCGEEERSDAEAHLIRLAGQHTLEDLKRLANRVIEVIDPDGAEEILGAQLQSQERLAWDATRLTMRRRGDGTTRGTFVIPDADADILRAGAEGLAAPRRNQTNAARHSIGVEDLKSLPHAQRLGLAFIELISHLPKEALPQAGGLAATVAITVPFDVMESGRGTALNTSGTAISAAKAQRMACNSQLVALYLDSQSRVIDHGMTKRLFDRHQRLALAVRDRGCVWAGCDRPPAWCEAHHLDFWSRARDLTASSRSSRRRGSTPTGWRGDTADSPDNSRAPPEVTLRGVASWGRGSQRRR